MKTIAELRVEIDLLDEELLKIIAKRMDIVREIGNLKKEKNLEALDKNRWQSVQKRIKEAAKNNNLSEEFVEKLYQEIHQAALKLQGKI